MQVAAVLGSPIAHSLSPTLHEAAYHALGFSDWEYTKIECEADELPEVVGEASPEMRGFSVTMPGKEAALAFADTASERAVLVGSANTLVRIDSGWYADCTDIDGADQAIKDSGWTDGPIVILGAGGTARPYVAACKDNGAEKIVIASRSRERADKTIKVAEALDLDVSWVGLHDTARFNQAINEAELVISTLPADAAAAYVESLKNISRFIDVTYAPWPTTVARMVSENGGTVISGLTMLVHQATTQVELFTGRKVTPSVLEAMTLALP